MEIVVGRPDGAWRWFAAAGSRGVSLTLERRKALALPAEKAEALRARLAADNKGFDFKTTEAR